LAATTSPSTTASTAPPRACFESRGAGDASNSNCWGGASVEGVDEQEAKDRCEELAREHPDRETHRWVPVQRKDGSWAIAKINLPPAKPTGTETRVTKSDAEDPRQLPPWLNPPSGGFT
jgi:hypothetical protein